MDGPTYLSGELNTSLPGERGSKALPRRPMRVDAASEPSARDAARGVIGLSAFANNRKGDARSADTCVERRRARVPVSLSLVKREYKCEKIASFHSVRCRSTIAIANAPRVRHPSTAESAHRKHRKTRGKTQWLSSRRVYARHPSVAPVVPVSSPRHRRSSSSSVLLPHPPPRCVLVASSVVAPTCSRARVALTRESSRRAPCVVFSTCPSVFHVSECVRPCDATSVVRTFET